MSEVIATDTDDGVSDFGEINMDTLNMFIEELTPTGKNEYSNNCKEGSEEEEINLYHLLDIVPNGRKTINRLFYSSTSKDSYIRSFADTQIFQKSKIIGNGWFNEEKRASTNTIAAVLSLETPVQFSWSKKRKNTTKNDGDDTIKHVDNSNISSKNKNGLQESTNRKLYRSILSGLLEVEKQIKQWQDLDKNSDVNIKIDQDTRGSNIFPKSKQPWDGSSFKVDPLQAFVVKELPKESKKKETPKKKKMGLLWFLGSRSNNSNHKLKNSKVTEPIVDKNHNNVIEERSHIDQFHQNYSHDPPINAAPFIDSRSSIFQFDIDDFRDETVLNNTIHPSNEDTIPTSDNDNLLQLDTTPNVKQTEPDNEEPDPDSDFGEFEQANSFSATCNDLTKSENNHLHAASSLVLPPPAPTHKAMPSFDAKEIKSTASDSSDNAGMSSLNLMHSFSPLQPTKKV